VIVKAVPRRLAILPAAVALLLASPLAASAQVARTPPSIEGYAMFGGVNLTAAESFEAIVGESSGTIVGGGLRVGLGLAGVFFDIGAWHFQAEGERVFIFDDEVIGLGIPVDVKMTPIEITAGWRFRVRKLPKLIPFAGGGLTSMRYEETSEALDASEDADGTFNGYHVLGGAEYKIRQWLGVVGEASWSTIPDAIGKAGVSKAFNETDLGGTTVRLKITIGQ
jgi:opacity protein-like surface antigen